MRLQSGFHPEPDKNGEDVRKENLALKPGAQPRMLQHGSSCPQQPAPTAQLIQQPAPPTANMVQQTLAFQPAPTAQLIQQPAPHTDNMFQPAPTAPHFQTAHPAQQFQTAHPAQQFQMTPAAQNFQTTPMAHNLQQVPTAQHFQTTQTAPTTQHFQTAFQFQQPTPAAQHFQTAPTTIQTQQPVAHQQLAGFLQPPYIVQQPAALVQQNPAIAFQQLQQPIAHGFGTAQQQQQQMMPISQAPLNYQYGNVYPPAGLQQGRNIVIGQQQQPITVQQQQQPVIVQQQQQQYQQAPTGEQPESCHDGTTTLSFMQRAVSAAQQVLPPIRLTAATTELRENMFNGTPVTNACLINGDGARFQVSGWGVNAYILNAMVPGQTYTLYNCRSHELRMGSPSDLWYRIGFERNNSGIDPNPLLCQMQQQQLQILGSGQQLAVQIQHEPSNAPSAPPCIPPPEGQIPAPQISVQVSNAHEDPPQNQVAAQATGTPVSS